MIDITPAAIREVTRFLKSQKLSSEAVFRLGVAPGGCSGLYYTMEFGPQSATGDRIYDLNGIKVAISESSVSYLNGLTLDYSEDLMGGGFRFKNPNATNSCGCGYSFYIESPSDKNETCLGE